MRVTTAQAEQILKWSEVHPDGCDVEDAGDGDIEITTPWEGLKATDPRFVSPDGTERIA